MNGNLNDLIRDYEQEKHYQKPENKLFSLPLLGNIHKVYFYLSRIEDMWQRQHTIIKRQQNQLELVRTERKSLEERIDELEQKLQYYQSTLNDLQQALNVTVEKPDAILMLSPHRTGSNLLMRALENVGFAGTFRAYFSPKMLYEYVEGESKAGTDIEDAWYRENVTNAMFDEYIEHCIARETNLDYKIFGTKFHFHHVQMIEEILDGTGQKDFIELLSPYFKNITFIMTVRKNKVAQAISFARALQDGKWTSNMRIAPPDEYVFDFDHILTCFQQTIVDEFLFHTRLKKHNITPIYIMYEDFAENYTDTVRRVLEQVYPDYQEDMPIPEPYLQKQANEVNVEWERRFREDTADWLTPEVEAQLNEGIIPPSLPFDLEPEQQI